MKARLSLRDVAEKLNVHIATVNRWAFHGVRGRTLRTFLVGGRRYVNHEDLDQFLANPCKTEPADTTTRTQEAQVQLEALGLRQKSE